MIVSWQNFLNYVSTQQEITAMEPDSKAFEHLQMLQL